MYGFSYVGATQLLAALMRPPHLAAIAPGFTSSDYYDGWTYQGGALFFAFALSWAVNLAVEDTRHRGDAACEMEMQDLMFKIGDWHRFMPLAQIAAAPAKRFGCVFLRLVGTSDPGRILASLEYSCPLRPNRGAHAHISGWYDVFLEGKFRIIEESTSRVPIRTHGRINSFSSDPGRICHGRHASASSITARWLRIL